VCHFARGFRAARRDAEAPDGGAATLVAQNGAGAKPTWPYLAREHSRTLSNIASPSQGARVS